PRPEPHIGLFAGVKRSAPKDGQPQGPPRTDLPAGMGSVAAAGSASLVAQTPAGALVRTPEGHHVLVPIGQVTPQMPGVPMGSANAFTVAPGGYMPAGPGAMPQMPPDGPMSGGNAFAMGNGGRPIPADLAMANYGPNAFMADGMGGAEYRPPT